MNGRTPGKKQRRRNAESRAKEINAQRERALQDILARPEFGSIPMVR